MGSLWLGSLGSVEFIVAVEFIVVERWRRLRRCSPNRGARSLLDHVIVILGNIDLRRNQRPGTLDNIIVIRVVIMERSE